MKIKPDFIYSMKNSIDDKLSRPLHFNLLNGEMRWEKGNEIITASFEDELSNAMQSQRLRTALMSNTSYMETLIKQAFKKLEEIRSKEQPNAKLILIAMDKNHLRSLAQLTKNAVGINPLVVSEDVSDSYQKIENFKNDHSPAIFSVSMLKEGVNIKSARVMVYATNIVQQSTFEQIVTRVVRKENFTQQGPGYVFLPNDPRLVENSRKIEGMKLVTIVPEVREEEEEISNSSSGTNSSSFNPISALETAELGIFRGTWASDEELELAKQWRIKNPDQYLHITDTELGKILGTISPPINKPNKAQNNLPPETYDDKIKRLKRRAQKQANHLAILVKKEPRDIHGAWLKNGGTRHDDAHLEDLEKKNEWLYRQIKKVMTTVSTLES